MLDLNEENVDKKTQNSKEEIQETSKDILKNTTTVDSTTEAVEEIEKSVAESAENEKDNDEAFSTIDYKKLSLEELVLELKNTVSNNSVHKIKSQVDAIKTAFNKKFGDLLAEKKEVFLAEGGNSIDFQFSSPLKLEYNSLLSDYKTKRDAYYANVEKQLNENLEKRLAVIENLKKLIQNAEPATMYKNFKEIQDSWQTIGNVSKSHYNDTWKTYHHHVERFYDLLHLSNDFRDLDFKHNLEEKLKIIEKAETLAEHSDINFAFKELQDLHKTWKEDIGPVSKEMREEVWQKFSEATKKIHDKRHDYFREMRSKYQDIIDKKLEIIAKINNYDTLNNSNHLDWQNSINQIEDLRKQYFAAGKLPYNKSEEVWQQFKAATKKFNSAKNVFYKQEKDEQQDNLQKKINLIEIAESIKNNEDWEETSNKFKKIQADWKKIGHVPRKFSDNIWKRFKLACNHFFDRYHQQKNAISKDQQEIVDAKNKFIETLKEQEKHTKNTVLGAINTWRDLGRLPRNARHLDSKFNKLIDRLLENLSIDNDEVTMLKFTNTIDSYAANNDIRKLDSEQLFVRKKIDEIVREIQQLENNLGFFSNATENNPLVINVKNKVEEFKNNLTIWKDKLSYLKNLEY